MHTRLSTEVSADSLVLDYGQHLRDHLVGPLVKGGADSVDSVVAIMGDYSLLRKDLEGLLEVNQWPDRPDPLSSVDSKTKAALTRKYNKDGAALPYSISKAIKINNGGGEDMMIGEEEGVEEKEDDENVENDASIKLKKHKVPVKVSDKGGDRGKVKGRK